MRLRLYVNGIRLVSLTVLQILREAKYLLHSIKPLLFFVDNNF